MGMEIRYGPNHGGWLVMNLNLMRSRRKSKYQSMSGCFS